MGLLGRAGAFYRLLLMETLLVLTVIGADRPGLVELLASTVRKSGGNWLESRMCHLGGQFAGILRVSVAEEGKAELLEALGKLEPQGLTVASKDAGEDANGSSCREIATVEIVGNDRPGIVSEISKVFARRGVNVEELETECRSAPMAGGRLFVARARVCIPEGCDAADLRAELERIAADLMVDVSFA